MDTPTARTISPVFVGRRAELAALTDALGQARDGRPQTCVVGGDAGLGKSRLLTELRRVAEDAGAVTAVGSCEGSGTDGLAYAPIAAVLRALHRQLGDVFTAAAAGGEGELARLLPELGEVAPPAVGEAVARTRLFALTARLLERLSADRPLVVAVEDLHWADRSTRELLGHLVRSVQPSRLLLLATYRSDDLHRRHPLRPFLVELDRVRAVRRFELSPLTRAEVASQAAGIRGAEPGQQLVGTVFHRSEGNPFFVEELLADGATHGMSASLRDLLLVRIETLDEDAQEVLRLVAEGGASVEHALLAEVAGCPEGALLGSLRAGVEAHVLVPTDDGEGYRFRHALMREAVTDDLLPGERVRIHRRFAETLTRHPHLVAADQWDARIARHWYHAHDPARALPAVLRAAAAAGDRTAYAEQLRLLERALELWESAPEETRVGLRPVQVRETYPRAEDDPPDLVDLLARAVEVAGVADQSDRALALSKQALRLLDEAAEPLRAAWFLVHRSRAREALGNGDGLEELERAQRLLAGLPPSATHAYLASQLASWQAVHRPGPESFAGAERAVELARLVGAEGVELHARFTLGTLTAESGDIDGGIAQMRAVRDGLVARGAVGLLGRTLVNLASELASAGRPEKALRAAEEGRVLAQRYGLAEVRDWLDCNEARVLYELGRWDEAERLLRHASDACGFRPRGAALTGLAQLAFDRGDLQTAQRHLAEARQVLDVPNEHPQFVLPMDRLAVQLAAARGRLAEARAWFADAAVGAAVILTARYQWPLLVDAATAEADARALPAAAAGRAEALARIRERLGTVPAVAPLWQAAELRVRAELRRAEGDDAPDHWQQVVEAYEALPQPHHLAVTRLRWAEALLTRGENAGGRAGRLLRQVVETAEQLGAAPLRGQAAGLASRAGVDVTRERRAAASGASGSPAGHPFGLTRRERDVLVLLAEGRSNRQIAQELFIAPKTASVHVSNILAKLEVSGRGEAAALAHRMRLVSGADEPAGGLSPRSGG